MKINNVNNYIVPKKGTVGQVMTGITMVPTRDWKKRENFTQNTRKIIKIDSGKSKQKQNTGKVREVCEPVKN